MQKKRQKSKVRSANNVIEKLCYQEADGHALDAVVGDGEHPVVRPQLRLVVHLHHGGQARPEYVRI